MAVAFGADAASLAVSASQGAPVLVDWANLLSNAAVNFAFVAVLGGAAAFLWNRAMQRRERDLAAAARFHGAYGRWFATWKAWEEAWDRVTGKDATKPWPADGDERSGRADLLKRAMDVEGEFEALLIKIVAERRLSEAEIDRLGRFREGYQNLRECIEERTRLPFRVQRVDEEVTAYAAFKGLSVEFAALLGGGSEIRRLHGWFSRRSLPDAQEAFISVTSWRSEKNDKTHWYCRARQPVTAIAAWRKITQRWKTLEPGRRRPPA
jgi:membrane protein implicated in regulation of membrane protease activity